MEVTWMSPDAVPRIDYLRWKFGYRGHWHSGYPYLDILSCYAPRTRVYRPGTSEARAVRRRLCTGRPVSHRLTRWAFREIAEMAREYERYLDY